MNYRVFCFLVSVVKCAQEKNHDISLNNDVQEGEFIEEPFRNRYSSVIVEVTEGYSEERNFENGITFEDMINDSFSTLDPIEHFLVDSNHMKQDEPSFKIENMISGVSTIRSISDNPTYSDGYSCYQQEMNDPKQEEPMIPLKYQKFDFNLIINTAEEILALEKQVYDRKIDLNSQKLLQHLEQLKKGNVSVLKSDIQSKESENIQKLDKSYSESREQTENPRENKKIPCSELKHIKIQQEPTNTGKFIDYGQSIPDSEKSLETTNENVGITAYYYPISKEFKSTFIVPYKFNNHRQSNWRVSSSTDNIRYFDNYMFEITFDLYISKNLLVLSIPIDFNIGVLHCSFFAKQNGRTFYIEKYEVKDGRISYHASLYGEISKNKKTSAKRMRYSK